MVFRLSAALIAAMVVAGCHGDDGGDAVSQRIGSQGGTLEHPQGAKLRVPEGALAQAMTFSIASAPAGTRLPSGIVMGKPFVFGPEGSTFSTPVTVVLPIDVTRMPTGKSVDDVVVMTAQADGDPFTVMATRVADPSHVEAETTHFSIFVPVILSSVVDGGVDGGACAETCSGAQDGGADCQCTETCGASVFELQCSGSGPLGCACVENGQQTAALTLSFCPTPGMIETLCRSADGGVDGGVDGGTDAGTDGGFDGGTDGGFDGGSDAGSDGGFDGGTDAGSDGGFDGGTDGGFDGGSDGGFDGGTDGGFDGGSDGGFDGGSDGGFDGGTDAGFDGGFDGGTDAGSDGGFDGGTDAGSDGGTDAGFDGGADAGFDGGADAS